MKSKSKHLLKSLGTLLFSIIFFSVAYQSWKNLNTDLKNFDVYSGRIEKAGEVYHKESASKQLPSLVYYFDIKGLNRRLAIYRWRNNYSDLHKSLKVGDSITVYYHGNRNNNINTEVVQIEKGKDIIQSRNTYYKNERMLLIICLIFGSLFLAYSWQFYHSRYFGPIKLKEKKQKTNKKI